MFFERLAATGPVVLLVEDAQYADAGLLDFLDHLIDWTRNLPIYVLVFARPELSHARPGFGEGRSRAALTLDPLDAKSMDSLVNALVPGDARAARAAITAQAQGLPLFAVETVRALIDRDVVQPVEGVYQLVGAIGDLEVPGSLHALLAARLDALDPDVRHLVTDAAVLGPFPAEALIAVSAEDEPAFRAGLAELLRREVLSVSADPLSPERGSTGSRSRCCARWPTKPCPGATARAATWPSPPTCAPRSPGRRRGGRRHRAALPGRAGRRARRPRHGWPA